MKKATKAWLVAAGVLVLSGCVLFVGVAATRKWDIKQLSAGGYKKNTYAVEETFRNIAMTTDTESVRFVLADDGKCRVECLEEGNAGHTVTVEDDTLTVKVNDQRPWYERIGLHFALPQVTVYLPQTEYAALSVQASTGSVTVPQAFTFDSADVSLSTGNVDFSASVSETAKLKATTGYIRVEDVTVGALDLSVTTGKVTVAGVTCKGDLTVGVTTGDTRLTDVVSESVLSDGKTGGITLRNVVAAKKLSAERSTGDVRFSRCDAAEIYVETTTGDVTGSLLSEKVFITDTNMGSVNVPKTMTGGRCEISTTTGDIEITID